MQDLQSALELTFHQTGDLLDQLDHLLDEEQALLRQRLYQELIPLSEQKERVMGLLSRSHQEREQLLAQLKLSHTQTGLREFIETYARKPEAIRELWAQTQDKLQSCRHKNTVNGNVISVNLQSNQRLLNLLKGKNTNEALYDSHGQISL